MGGLVCVVTLGGRVNGRMEVPMRSRGLVTLLLTPCPGRALAAPVGSVFSPGELGPGWGGCASRGSAAHRWGKKNPTGGAITPTVRTTCWAGHPQAQDGQ